MVVAFSAVLRHQGRNRHAGPGQHPLDTGGTAVPARPVLAGVSQRKSGVWGALRLVGPGPSGFHRRPGVQQAAVRLSRGVEQSPSDRQGDGEKLWRECGRAGPAHAPLRTEGLPGCLLRGQAPAGCAAQGSTGSRHERGGIARAARRNDACCGHPAGAARRIDRRRLPQGSRFTQGTRPAHAAGGSRSRRRRSRPPAGRERAARFGPAALRVASAWPCSSAYARAGQATRCRRRIASV